MFLKNKKLFPLNAIIQYVKKKPNLNMFYNFGIFYPKGSYEKREYFDC